MSRILIVVTAIVAVAGLSACTTIGKGKGKAPAVVEDTAPAPVYK
ncbi:ABC transporter [Mesorhizobium sp. LHD-90]|nr:ABC transporter [Mesorhizobium sp. LHD-90]MDQ6433627.1 ABC transporter [Mesorhizobium sp. LHD-90]